MKSLYNRKTLFIVVILISVCIALVAWGENERQEKQDVIHDLEVFARVLEKVRSYYVDDVDTHQLIRDAIEKMLGDLDPHSQFLEGLDYEDLMVSTRGEYGGLGIFISFRDDYPTVISPIEGTPADRVGLRGGDQIVEIEGQDTKGWHTSKAVELLRGDAGTSVSFKVQRPGLSEPVAYSITREIINVKSVPFYGMFGDYGYIKISNFAKQTREEMEEALKELEKQHMKGLVLDLRSNPGGLLQAATEVSELFLGRDKLVVYTKGRLANSNQKYFSSNSHVHNGYPIVVMINMASASASEIVAGALQDWDAAVVVGQTSFGKGTVQTVFSLSDSEAVKLTTAKYYTPSGRNIHRDDHGKADEGEDSTIAIQADDSTGEGGAVPAAKVDKPIFYTASGRVVYGGGGITPDLEFEPLKYTDLERKLERDVKFFSFAIEYSKNHQITEQFRITEEIVTEFKDYLKKEGYTFKEEDFNDPENHDYIKMALSREIVSANLGRRSMYRVVLEQDPEFQNVLSMFHDAPTLDKLFALVEARKSLKEARVK